ncbi:MAG: carboxylate-amine ligase, partial [Gammaproteobacteria bacterium]|nr:carboxylate-amine ligase [Gammaproteobacteria bacterium]
MKAPSFTIGVEEEYLLVDRQTGELVEKLPEQMLEQCEALAEGQQVAPEFLRSQIEIGTRICNDIGEVRESLGILRHAVIDVADRHGLAPIAVSTHPFAHWTAQKHTARSRYDALSEEFQATANRLLICGMHVHIGVDDDELRIDLMNQASYFLPHLLALSTSSPFWEGIDTGLKSYRVTVFDTLPRTGLPEHFASFADFEHLVGVMVNAGLIEDSTHVWWDIRPSGRYPTLELRIMDVCTDIDDAVCLAAIVQSVMRMLYRLRAGNRSWRSYSRVLINENRWRAMRYSFDKGLIDLGRGNVIPCAALYEELIEMIREDAEALGCLDEVLHLRKILQRGTSAHR